jgi:hypothetical protein
MEKSIEDYQKEIKSLQHELDCYIKTSEIKSSVVQRQKDILDKTLYELPVGSIKNHTYESIPDRVKYFVREYAILEQEKDAVDELIVKTMPNFFDNPKAGSILDNVTILIEMANKAMLDAWTDREKLERLEKEIETFYEYYAGFGAKKGLTTTQMLNHILQTVPNYKPTKEEYDLEDMKRHCDHYIKALTEITKKNRKAETCRLIALKALGELTDEDYQPELLIEENLALRMKVEDLESQIINITLEKDFDKESFQDYAGWEQERCGKAHPLMDCPDCGKHWDYHHEEHCEAKL